ncbi:MAG: aminotransferase class IV [Bacteroidetes bacterium]|nr:aminotransferase class IV [Bacteroidota bacterium]
MQYINYNGNIHPESEHLLPVTNRAFRYGDGFFESMAMFNKKIPLLDYHWSRIDFTAEVFFALLPFRLTVEKFSGHLLDLCSVNEVSSNARIRLQFYRKGTGMYISDQDELGYVISMDPMDNSQFQVGSGLKAGIREDCYKAVSMISDLKNSSALMYLLAAQLTKKEGWEECILTNQYGQVCEALHSNIFLVKGEKMFTPDLDAGCVNGVLRTYLISILEDTVEERAIDVEELFTADEILLTNAVRGVQWVKEFNGKVYKNKKALELTTLLNKNLL